MNHGIALFAGDDRLFSWIWDLAEERGQWPFVAFYAWKGNQLCMFGELWKSCYVSSIEPAAQECDSSGQPIYLQEFARFEPKKANQFIKMCRSVRGSALVVPSQLGDSAVKPLLHLPDLILELIAGWFAWPENPRKRFRDLLKHISLQAEWACFLDCCDDMPSLIFVSDDASHVTALKTVAEGIVPASSLYEVW